MIIAVVMAGGKGERLKADCEKPLFPLKNKFLIDYVLNNLNQSDSLDKIVIATSPNTSKTKDYLVEKYNASSLDFNLINNDLNNSKFYYLDTPGGGYVEDLSFILDTFNEDSPNHILLFINSDLPLVNTNIINNVLEVYKNSDKLYEYETQIEKLSVKTNKVSNKILASNIFSQQEEEYYVYCYNFDSDEDLDAIDSAIASSNIAVYKVNTKEGLNSKYVSEEDNPNAKTLEELKVKSPTLLKISADQIVAYYNNKADILKALS